MKENRITKKMSDKGKFTCKYIGMTLLVFAIIFAIVIGVFAISSNMKVNAIEMEETTESHTAYTIKKDDVTPKPMAVHNADIKFTEIEQVNTEDKPEMVNLGEFKLTAYCSCATCCEQYAYNRPTDKDGNEIVYTASGAVAKSNYTIAADPSVLPYGTIVYINGQRYEVQDCGGAIKNNRIDIYFDSHEDACEFGVQYADVYMEMS